MISIDGANPSSLIVFWGRYTIFPDSWGICIFHSQAHSLNEDYHFGSSMTFYFVSSSVATVYDEKTKFYKQ